jgi:hypothetical protein
MLYSILSPTNFRIFGCDQIYTSEFPRDKLEDVKFLEGYSLVTFSDDKKELLRFVRRSLFGFKSGDALKEAHQTYYSELMKIAANVKPINEPESIRKFVPKLFSVLSKVYGKEDMLNILLSYNDFTIHERNYLKSFLLEEKI